MAQKNIPLEQIMNCLECYGTGWVPATLTAYTDEMKPCPAPGCHNGQVHCCDGEDVDLAPSRLGEDKPVAVVEKR